MAKKSKDWDWTKETMVFLEKKRKEIECDDVAREAESEFVKGLIGEKNPLTEGFKSAMEKVKVKCSLSQRNDIFSRLKSTLEELNVTSTKEIAKNYAMKLSDALAKQFEEDVNKQKK